MSLELKRKQVELSRVQTAKQEMELRVAERLDEIKRLEENIEIQIKAEIKINEELRVLKGK